MFLQYQLAGRSRVNVQRMRSILPPTVNKQILHMLDAVLPEPKRLFRQKIIPEYERSTYHKWLSDDKETIPSPS